MFVTERIRTRLVLLAAVAAVPAGIAAAAVIGQPASPLPAWMAGCWAGEQAGERFHERWTLADESTLLSVAHTTKGGKMTAFEFLRVILRNGKVVYAAQPGGAPPTEFTATTTTADRIVFENPSHDFPKRVIYERRGADRLTASIDDGTERKRMVFAMSREDCAR
jgi:uncharacterized protein DUF6265